MSASGPSGPLVLAGNEDNHKISDGSKFGKISALSKLPLSVWKNPRRLVMGEM